MSSRHRPASFTRLTAATALAAALILAGGCTSTGRGQAVESGKRGAIGGLVAGAVGSIFWGGDAMNNALRSAAVGAASGAAIGAYDGDQRARRNAKQAGSPAPAPTGTTGTSPAGSADNGAMRSLLGDANYAAGEELARCRHVSALAKAERAFTTETTPERKGYAMLIQAMAAEESSNITKASEVYRRWGQFDPQRADRNAARAEALTGLQKVQRIRQDNGLPPLCA